MYSWKLNSRILILNLEKFHGDDGWKKKKNREKLLKVRLGFTINWAKFEKIATSFDFIQHQFDRLTSLVLTNCFSLALIVVSVSIQTEHCSSVFLKITNEKHLYVHLFIDIVTQFSLRLKNCSVPCEMFNNSTKQFAALRVRNFSGRNRHSIFTEPRNNLLFRVQRLLRKMSRPLFHRYRKFTSPNFPLQNFKIGRTTGRSRSFRFYDDQTVRYCSFNWQRDN